MYMNELFHTYSSSETYVYIALVISVQMHCRVLKKRSSTRSSLDETTPKRSSLDETTPKRSSLDETTPKLSSFDETTPQRSSFDETTSKRSSLNTTRSFPPSLSQSVSVKQKDDCLYNSFYMRFTNPFVQILGICPFTV